MTKKIFRAIMIVAIAVFLACVVFILDILYQYYGNEQEKQLSAQLALAAWGVENSGMAYFEDLPTIEDRLTWVAEDGTVMYDSETDASKMENHGTRSEIKAALEGGEGESARYSTTHMEQTMYRARRLSDGTVLRISACRLTVPAILLSMQQPFLIVLAIALVLSFYLANRLSHRIVKPLEAINLEKPLEGESYDELAPILRRMESQQKQIRHQMQKLENARSEFEAITRTMREGLVLLNARSEIVSINASARALFHADAVVPGKAFVTVARNIELRDAVAHAFDEGHAEATLEMEGRLYHIEVNRMDASGEVAGVVLVAFDVTEKEQAEKMRREFTANVSHELKTPLQSIMGSAELLENGLVKAEDVPRFTARIRSESERLVALIEDIIGLSRMEEQKALTFEPCDLANIARETVASLQTIAEARGVEVTVTAGEAPMSGVPQLLKQIVYNLCDNAIKYNREGGHVSVTVARRGEHTVLTVSDNGIGIPLEHQGRIFERFYRVDKSRSRQSGGTGLGLSIVKHAVQIHHGSITLESRPELGTTIEIEFIQ